MGWNLLKLSWILCTLWVDLKWVLLLLFFFFWVWGQKGKLEIQGFGGLCLLFFLIC